MLLDKHLHKYCSNDLNNMQGNQLFTAIIEYKNKRLEVEIED